MPENLLAWLAGAEVEGAGAAAGITAGAADGVDMLFNRLFIKRQVPEAARY